MAKKFEIQKQGFPSVADAYNGLLGMDNNRVVNLPMSRLDEIDDQPFPINDSKVDQIADSIDAVGVLEPVIVAKSGDRYSILSGRHRFRACQKLGKTEIPCFIKDYSADDPTARFILLATNTDRNNEYAPTVYARAYAEQLELMKQLGKKATVSAIAENNNMSRKQIYRYIRLNELIVEFQQWVDKGIITIEAAVELSFISEEKQHTIFEHINGLGIADSVITRHFKVVTTKRIHSVADTISDDEFAANIDKILFSAYEAKTTVPTAQVGLEVPLPTTKYEKQSDITTEQPAPIKGERTAQTAHVGLEVPLPLTKDEMPSGIIPEQPAPIKEERTAPTTQMGLEVPLASNDVEHKAVIVTEQAVSDEENKAQDELKRILAKKNRPTIRFKNTEHEANYNFILDMMPCSDPERKALAYLFAVDTVCFEHIRELYDFEGDSIKPDTLDKAWQTGTSCKTTRLAFNLYNSFCSDRFENDLPSVSFTPVELFCSEYAEYYVEALRIRFPEFF